MAVGWGEAILSAANMVRMEGSERNDKQNVIGEKKDRGPRKDQAFT